MVGGAGVRFGPAWTLGPYQVVIHGVEMPRRELLDNFTHLLEVVLVRHPMVLVVPFNKDFQVFSWDVLGYLRQ